jgi:hypothetical protein
MNQDSCSDPQTFLIPYPCTQIETFGAHLGQTDVELRSGLMNKALIFLASLMLAVGVNAKGGH